MPRASLPANETSRLRALADLCVLDTPPEPGFDDLTALAAMICATPIAAVSLVDSERQWFKSIVGLCVQETDRDSAFCAHAILGTEPMVIADATQDPRTLDSRLVTGEPHLRFYAGVPLRDSNGFALGTLCVIDTVPRDIEAHQLDALRKLARQVVTQLELRRSHRAMAVRQAESARLAHDLASAMARAEQATEQIRSINQAIHAERERLELVLSATGLGSWDWNPQTGEAAFDARWAAMIGETRVSGNVGEWSSRVHPEDLTKAMVAVEEHFSGASAKYECVHRMRHKDGTWRWIRDQGVVVARDAQGRPTRMVGTHEDITDRTRAEEAMRSATEMLRRTGAMARVGGWELDVLSQQLTWSEEVYRIHELDPGVPITLDSAIAYYAPEVRERVADAVRQSMTLGQPWDLELPLITAKGRTIWVRAQGEAVARHGTVVRLLGTFQDVTEQRQAREELSRRATELERLRNAADAASRTKSEFLANMSHEIRTPLTAILGYTELLYEDGELAHAPPARLMAIEMIRRAGHHLLTVINDILDISKIEAGKMTFETIETPLIGILREVECLMRPRASEKGVALQVQLATPLPERVMTDPTRVRQVLLNLVGNATKFTKEGRIVITATMLALDTTPELVIDVDDTGPGMTPEQSSRLFAAFGQGDSTVTREHGGSGLGLTISRRLAGLMGGRVTLEWTEVGRGSRFRLRLPVAIVPGTSFVNSLTVAPADHATALPVRPTLSGRVLLAEDGPVNQRLICHHLRRAGAEVEVAANGKIALEMLARAAAAGKPFDLLITDIQMPEMDGYTLARTLRANGSDIPIVALTAFAMAEDRQKCLAAGCNDYASKPIDTPMLLRTCKRWLGTAVVGPD